GVYRPRCYCSSWPRLQPGASSKGGGRLDATYFGRYQLLGLIGEGAMGKAFKAHDTAKDRDAAIKVLPTDVGHTTQVIGNGFAARTYGCDKAKAIAPGMSQATRTGHKDFAESVEDPPRPQPQSSGIGHHGRLAG